MAELANVNILPLCDKNVAIRKERSDYIHQPSELLYLYHEHPLCIWNNKSFSTEEKERERYIEAERERERTGEWIFELSPGRNVHDARV